MNAMLTPVLASLLALCATSAGLAASTPWFETEGGGIRLIVSPAPTEDGRLLGAIEIDLKPGWKTYWRDPGGAGIPLQISLAGSHNVSGHEIRYPAPRRFDDGYSVYAGYDKPVLLAVSFDVPDPEKPVAINADVFLGICDTICIPVQTQFQLETGNETGSTPDAAIVNSAHAALPIKPGPGLRISGIRQDGNELVARVDATAVGDPDLYVVNSDGWYFGTPKAVEGADGLQFRIPLIEKPASGSGKPAAIEYTLIIGERSAEGAIALPE